MGETYIKNYLFFLNLTTLSLQCITALPKSRPGLIRHRKGGMGLIQMNILLFRSGPWQDVQYRNTDLPLLEA